MESNQIDMLCFGAHPDDIEIGMAGTIRKQVDAGYTVALCDLTLAELSSNGTPAERQLEAQEAASILGVTKRYNLQFPDRGLVSTPERLGAVVQLIRQLKPRVICLPFEEDRHPDHGMASRLVEEAIFNAGIRRYQVGEQHQEAHKVAQVFYYFINGLARPQLLVDITAYQEVKREALLAYRSQFLPTQDGVLTRLNTKFIEVIEGRDRWFGKMLDVDVAEGFMTKEPVLVRELVQTGKG